MATPSPPVALKNQCSIIHGGVLYVYSPDAFQTLPLAKGGQWSQERNGVSVTGATCVKGGIDGDNSKAALYVVGGASNASEAHYPGLQRYSIADKVWETITPVVPVTQNRQYHGSAYMNASSSIVVYGGSQDDKTGPSTQTFIVELYPPYRVQAFESTAPPVVNPVMLQWDNANTLMLGGGSNNVDIFTFNPGTGWQNLNLTLPAPLPNKSVAQCALLTLDDNSKVLETFDLSQSPNSLTRLVLENPMNQPATFNETVGEPTSTATGTSRRLSRFVRRSTYLNTLPAYNATDAPTTTRTGYSLAQDGNGLVAIVGGDAADSIALFDQTGSGWKDAQTFFGNSQSTSITSTSTPTSTASSTASATSSAAASPASHGANSSHGLTILGAVLGSLCGVAVILILLLLWLRSARRKRKRSEEHKRQRSAYPEDKPDFPSGFYEEDRPGPLSRAGQPMGRSPVPSAIVTSDADSIAMFGQQPAEKAHTRQVSHIRQVSNELKLNPVNHTFGHGMFKPKEKQRLTISKPILQDLGDYNVRDSIELGKATPIAVNPATPTVATIPERPETRPGLTARRVSQQRKTDEGWSKYFDDNRATYATRSSASTRGFWPGSGVPEQSTRSPKIMLRDSAGNALESQTVTVESPRVAQTRASVGAAHGMPGKISSGQSDDSLASDEEYEDEPVDPAFASRNASVAWPQSQGNTWSGPVQRPLRKASAAVRAEDFPMPTTSHSNQSNDTRRSSIPSFPMPGSTIRRISRQYPEPSQSSRKPFIHASTTLGPKAAQAQHRRVSSQDDMSWLKLGNGRR